MKTNKTVSCSLFEPATRTATHHQVMEMVKQAEREYEECLDKKRNRLKIQTAHEKFHYRQEILNKHEALREQDARIRAESLNKVKIDRELDRKKFVELQQLRQHFLGTEKLRLEKSKQLFDECQMSRDEQIRLKKIEKKTTEESESLWIQNQQRKLLEEKQKVEEALRMKKEQEYWRAKKELKEEYRRKLEEKQIKLTESEIERASMQQIDESRKKREIELKMNKIKEVQQQKEFLQRQIEQRKKDDEYERRQLIEYCKEEAERDRLRLKKESEDAENAKQMQSVENSKYFDFLKRMHNDKKKEETEKIDLKHLSFIHQDLEEAEAKQLKKMQMQRAELQTQYLKTLEKKQLEKKLQKQMERNEREEVRRQNAEYEQMMAAREKQNRQKFLNDIAEQIKFKEMERAFNLEQDLRHEKNVGDIIKSSDNLTQKLLTEGLESVLPSHPFYQCLKTKNPDTFAK